MYKYSKKISMKSNGCRDVQHTGLYKVQKQEGTIAATTLQQGAQTRGTWHITVHLPMQASLHQWLHYMSNYQIVFLLYCPL